MNEQREGQLSTADMVNAARERNTNGDGATTGTMNGGTSIPAQDAEVSNGHAAATGNGSNGSSSAASETAPLLSSSDSEGLRTRWGDIQAAFVDEPRRCVEQADSLVAELMQRLAEMFANERSGLEQQWDRGDQVSTEDLRQALRRYRSFFERLLSV